MLRLHGFHRFLPHLWELFYWVRWKPGTRSLNSAILTERSSDIAAASLGS